MACDHDNGVTITGKMESTGIDGVYVIPCKCDDCGKNVYEEYEYNGVVEDKQ